MNVSFSKLGIKIEFFVEKKLANMLVTDQTKWRQIRNEIVSKRIRSHKEAKFILNELKEQGIDIMRRAKTFNVKNGTINSTSHKYDSFDTVDEIDEFEHLDNIRGICDAIDENVLGTIENSTAYILTRYIVSNRTICSLSEIESHRKYPHVCEYGLFVF